MLFKAYIHFDYGNLKAGTIVKVLDVNVNPFTFNRTLLIEAGSVKGWYPLEYFDPVETDIALRIYKEKGLEAREKLKMYSLNRRRDTTIPSHGILLSVLCMTLALLLILGF